MNSQIKKLWMALIVIGIIAIGGYFHFGSKVFSGGPIHTVVENFTQGLRAGTSNQWSVSNTGVVTSAGMTVGSSGTAMTQILSGTCTLVSDSSIAATSTGTGTCAATGALAGDKVFVALATTTTKIAAQWQVIGTVAGTNTVTVRLLNLTGTAAVPSATNGLGSSTQYWIVR